MGKTCKLKDVSFQCMTKFTTKKKKKPKACVCPLKVKKKKNKIKKKEKKKKNKIKYSNDSFFLFLPNSVALAIFSLL